MVLRKELHADQESYFKRSRPIFVDDISVSGHCFNDTEPNVVLFLDFTKESKLLTSST